MEHDRILILKTLKLTYAGYLRLVQVLFDLLLNVLQYWSLRLSHTFQDFIILVHNRYHVLLTLTALIHKLIYVIVFITTICIIWELLLFNYYIVILDLLMNRLNWRYAPLNTLLKQLLSRFFIIWTINAIFVLFALFQCEQHYDLTFPTLAFVHTFIL